MYTTELNKNVKPIETVPGNAWPEFKMPEPMPRDEPKPE